MAYKIAIEQLRRIIDDAWVDGWSSRGEYQCSQSSVYTEETIRDIGEIYEVTE